MHAGMRFWSHFISFCPSPAESTRRTVGRLPKTHCNKTFVQPLIKAAELRNDILETSNDLKIGGPVPRQARKHFSPKTPGTSAVAWFSWAYGVIKAYHNTCGRGFPDVSMGVSASTDVLPGWRPEKGDESRSQDDFLRLIKWPSDFRCRECSPDP